MFEDIKPYNDAQASAALKKASKHPLLKDVSAFVYPDLDTSELKHILSDIRGVDDFQTKVMYPAVKAVINRTTGGLTYNGLDWFRQNPTKRFLLLSNHRDIVMDSAFVQFILKDNNLPLSEIAVGDNLIANSFIEYLMRSNRMVKVIRSSNPREVYTTSVVLSDYIRRRITGKSVDSPEGLAEDGGSSIWLASRNGRTKDGYDLTEQGLLKMLDMSGSGDFVENFKQISILPVSISYELEPCAIRKAVELWKKQKQGFYKKAPMEDIESIITGILQQKGRVHVEFCKPITDEELADAAQHSKNERLRRLAEIIDERIVSAYRIWPTNVNASKMLKGEKPDDLFENYLAAEMSAVPDECNREEVKELLLRIYSNPLDRKS